MYDTFTSCVVLYECNLYSKLEYSGTNNKNAFLKIKKTKNKKIEEQKKKSNEKLGPNPIPNGPKNLSANFPNIHRYLNYLSTKFESEPFRCKKAPSQS